MTIVIGEYESGQLTIRPDVDKTVISIHWPFDRSTDEWIDASAIFTKADGLSEDGSEENKQLLLEEGTNRLRLNQLSDGRYRLELRGANAYQPVEADVVLPREVGGQLEAALISEWI